MVVIDIMFNPGKIATGKCFINCYSANCVREDEVECERGENYKVWSQLYISFAYRVEGYDRLSLHSFLTSYLLYLEIQTSDDLCITSYNHSLLKNE
jgi:hypothetical protein